MLLAVKVIKKCDFFSAVSIIYWEKKWIHYGYKCLTARFELWPHDFRRVARRHFKGVERSNFKGVPPGLVCACAHQSPGSHTLLEESWSSVKVRPIFANSVTLKVLLTSLPKQRRRFSLPTFVIARQEQTVNYSYFSPWWGLAKMTTFGSLKLTQLVLHALLGTSFSLVRPPLSLSELKCNPYSRSLRSVTASFLACCCRILANITSAYVESVGWFVSVLAWLSKTYRIYINLTLVEVKLTVNRYLYSCPSSFNST